MDFFCLCSCCMTAISFFRLGLPTKSATVWFEDNKQNLQYIKVTKCLLTQVACKLRLNSPLVQRLNRWRSNPSVGRSETVVCLFVFSFHARFCSIHQIAQVTQYVNMRSWSDLSFFSPNYCCMRVSWFIVSAIWVHCTQCTFVEYYPNIYIFLLIARIVVLF